jgi:hypothetical protein
VADGQFGGHVAHADATGCASKRLMRGSPGARRVSWQADHDVHGLAVSVRSFLVPRLPPWSAIRPSSSARPRPDSSSAVGWRLTGRPAPSSWTSAGLAGHVPGIVAAVAFHPVLVQAFEPEQIVFSLAHERAEFGGAHHGRAASGSRSRLTSTAVSPGPIT